MLKIPTDYYTLDFETNGLPSGDDVSEVDFTEIGHIFVKDKEYQKDRVIQRLAKPTDANGVQIPLTAKIVEITHITDDMLKNEPPPLEVAKVTFKEVVESDFPVVGHNIIGFDRLFLDKYCDILGWKCISKERYIDTAAIFKAYRRAHRAKNKDWQLPSSQSQFFDWAMNALQKSWAQDQVKYNLDAAVGYLVVPQFGIPYDRHRAIFDVILTHKVLERLREEMQL